jgi:predicted nuclease of predicted toxin-antitoxin system
MRFLVDECTGKKLANLLEKEGHDVLFAGDAMPSVSDDEIIRRSKENDRILITDDKDFGELVFRLRKPTKGVILLRIGVDPEKRLKALVKLLKRYEITGKFAVLKEDSVRIRTIH